MKFRNLFVGILIVSMMLLAAACQEKTFNAASGRKVQISLSEDSSAVELHFVRADVLEYLRSDSIGLKEWQSFFSVYPDPGDPELRDFQKPVSGSYTLRDSAIVFIPEKQFEKDSLYFARCYTRQIIDEPSDLVMGGKLSATAEFVEFEFRR